MDYILFLERHSAFGYGQSDFFFCGQAKDILAKVVVANGLRYRKVMTKTEVEPDDRFNSCVDELVYDDYVVEVPHEKAEEVALFLKRDQDMFNVVLSGEHQATADWPAIIRSHDREQDVPIVRIRSLLGH